MAVAFHYSGGLSNVDPDASLGGPRALAVIEDGDAFNNLWDDVLAGEASAGDSEYRLIYVLNNAGRPLNDVTAYVAAQAPGGEVTLGLAAPNEAKNTEVPAVANESTSPLQIDEDGTITFNPATAEDGATVWTDAAYSPSLDRWVIVGQSGDTGDRIQYSDDGGENWTSAGATDHPFTGVDWSPTLELFVAVSSDGQADTSADGITWTSRAVSGSPSFHEVRWVPWLSLFVAVSAISSSAQNIRTSTDGINWTVRTTSANAQFHSVGVGSNRLVVVGVEDDIWYSDNGTAWTVASTPLTCGTGDFWNSVSYSPALGVWVASSYDGATRKLIRSADGDTWTAPTDPNAGATNYPKVQWVPELARFVVSSNSSSNLESTDGTTFSNVASAPAGNTFAWRWSSDAEQGIMCDTAGSPRINRVIAPTEGLTFASPSEAASGINLGNLNDGEYRGLWLRRVVGAGAAADVDNLMTLAIQSAPA